jgi:hypothetical protein
MELLLQYQIHNILNEEYKQLWIHKNSKLQPLGTYRS